MRKTIAIAALALAIAFPAGAATITPELADEHGLVAMKSRHFDDVVGKSMAPLGEVAAIYITDLDFSEVEIDEPDRYNTPRERGWKLTEKDVENLNALYRAALVERIEKGGGYRVVAEPGEGVLTISAAMLELNPAAPKDDFSSRDAFTKYVTEGAGSAKISFTVSSGDDVYMVINDYRDAGNDWGINDRMRNRHDVKRLFGSWAGSLARQLAF
jgi:hypothetical protein